MEKKGETFEEAMAGLKEVYGNPAKPAGDLREMIAQLYATHEPLAKSEEEKVNPTEDMPMDPKNLTDAVEKRCIRCHSLDIEEFTLKCGHYVCHQCVKFFVDRKYVCGGNCHQREAIKKDLAKTQTPPESKGGEFWTATGDLQKSPKKHSLGHKKEGKASKKKKSRKTDQDLVYRSPAEVMKAMKQTPPESKGGEFWAATGDLQKNPKKHSLGHKKEGKSSKKKKSRKTDQDLVYRSPAEVMKAMRAMKQTPPESKRGLFTLTNSLNSMHQLPVLSLKK